MDNTNPEILNYKCHLFNRLYHNAPCRTPSCLDVRISDEYMCPKVGAPVKPSYGHCDCTDKRDLIGKHHLCDDDEPPREVHSRNGRDLRSASAEAERLNTITKDGVIERLNSLKNNSDFIYSTNLIKKGGIGLKNYVLQHTEMLGGSKRGQDIIGRLANSLSNTASHLGSFVNSYIQKAGNETVSGTLERFINYYETGVVPFCDSPQLNRRLNRLIRDKEDCSRVLGQAMSSVGELTVGDVLNMVYNISGEKEVNSLVNKCAQTGGMVYHVVTVPIYDEDEYVDKVVELFEQLKSTVNYVCNMFKKRMVRNRMPNEVIDNVDHIQKGLNMCLQMIRYEILTGKKKDPQSRQCN